RSAAPVDPAPCAPACHAPANRESAAITESVRTDFFNDPSHQNCHARINAHSVQRSTPLPHSSASTRQKRKERERVKTRSGKNHQCEVRRNLRWLRRLISLGWQHRES